MRVFILIFIMMFICSCYHMIFVSDLDNDLIKMNIKQEQIRKIELVEDQKQLMYRIWYRK